jgi:ligand-binding SRPBCC domain-containing protein
MAAGTLIDYRLQLFGVPFSWRTRIESYQPCERFIDRQLRGPYTLWHHLHEFYEVPEGTLMVDRVDYAIPLGLLGRAAYHLFVRTTLDKIFDFRRDRINELLSSAEHSNLQANSVTAAIVGS